jgi:hypothetical protein
VDEYRLLIRAYLRSKHPEIKMEGGAIHHIFFTHDVDEPFRYRSWKGVLRSMREGRGLLRSLKGHFGPPENDPYYTFPSLLEQEQRLAQTQNASTLLFFKAGGKTPQDKPHYRLRSKDMRRLIRLCDDRQAKIGLHASYEAGINPRLIAREKQRLQKALPGKFLADSRHHFLSCREPEDLDYLETAGITHDFTMGYADIAGFRLGTSFPVRWINPVSRRLSDLHLYPLTIMDCTLEREGYMGLTYEQATACCSSLIEEVRKVGGCLTLLWHNSSVAESQDNYLCELYTYVLNYLDKP